MAATTVQREIWFRAIGTIATSGPTVLCFPHAGGAASAFRNWKARLPKSVNVLATQYPGHEVRWRERVASEVCEIVVPLAMAIRAGKYENLTLFGHSMGALIAFEVAREMRRNGWPLPLHLFVSGSRAPQEQNLRPPIHPLSEADFLDHVRQLGGIPDEVLADVQLMEMLLPVLRSDIRLDETYRYEPEPPLDCDISVFIGAYDPEVSLDQARAWQVQSRGSFQLEIFPAGHWWSPECEDAILQEIASRLSNVAPVSNVATRRLL
jgi:medium-chain acyl-[acyl-carrier-protein] hydrolase